MLLGVIISEMGIKCGSFNLTYFKLKVRLYYNDFFLNSEFLAQRSEKIGPSDSKIPQNSSFLLLFKKKCFKHIKNTVKHRI